MNTNVLGMINNPNTDKINVNFILLAIFLATKPLELPK